jgi:NAD(P)H-hydrate repair Nnr-like enzyme with NAD(P)H-hydrate epimerase domain
MPCRVRSLAASHGRSSTRWGRARVAFAQNRIDLLGGTDLLIDALRGYRRVNPSVGRMAELVAASGDHRILALDVPTGAGAPPHVSEPTLR